MSFPHCYEAAEYYLNQVEELKADKNKHQFYMTLEPVSLDEFVKDQSSNYLLFIF